MFPHLPPDSPGSGAVGQEAGTLEAGDFRRARHAALLMARYNLRYLVRLYVAFDGDLLLPLVLGEVALYNTGGRPTDDPEQLIPPFHDAESFRRLPLRPCNAFSISASTGIPRETVRRKVGQMIRQGLIERDRKGGLTITASAVGLCMQPFDTENRSDFLATAEQVRMALTPSD